MNVKARRLSGPRAALSLLLFALLAHTFLHDADGQTVASPPHLVRIVGAPAHVQLPGGGQLELPVGAEFAARDYRYDPAGRVTEITATAEIFRGGFED